jgi:subtilisin-like proprotein convertase family protein
LRVRDVEGQDTGVLRRWTIEVQLETGPQIVRGEVKPALKIPDNDPTGVSSVIGLVGAGAVRQLRVAVDITHTYIGDLRIELLSPTGRRAILHAQLGGSTDDLLMTYDSAAPSSVLSSFVGQPIEGAWTLRVVDLAGQDSGRLNKWSVEALAS